MKAVLLSLAVGFIFSVSSLAECGGVPKTGPFLSYVIEPNVDQGKLSLEVTLAFRLKEQNTDLVLPSEWQGQKELYKAISDLRLITGGASLRDGNDPSLKKLSFPAGRIVELRYVVTRDWQGQIDSSSYFRVMFGSDYFQVTGHNFLVYPSVPEDTELPFSVEWKNLSPEWSLVSSFGGGARCASGVITVSRLANCLFAGGLLRVKKVLVAGEPVFIATRGQWEFTDAEFSDLVARILVAERGFWHDRDIPNYVLTLLPSDDAPGNYGGTALENSFALFMGPENRLDFQIKFLLAHEMFHRWNAGRLGEIRTDPPFWFIEGFTDYYARLLLLRSGLITASVYSDDLEAAYREYVASSQLHAKGKLLEEKFYSDGDLQRLAYLRGNLLALRWDQLIRQKSQSRQSLDDGMLSLFYEAKQKEIVLTDRFLAQHFGSYLGPQAVDDIQKFIEDGDKIPFAGSGASTSSAPGH